MLQRIEEEGSRPLTPKEMRLQRLQSIKSRMDQIKSEMGPEDWARLDALSRLGAAHYQCEEDFINTPAIRRSLSVPSTNLAEHYDRLRAASSPRLLSPRLAPDRELLPPIESACPSVRTLDMMGGPLDIAMLTRSLPTTHKQPTRIFVKSHESDEDSSMLPSPVPDLGEIATSDIFLDPVVFGDDIVPAEARARLSKKRGSDPDICQPVAKKTKKKKKRFFGRIASSPEPESAVVPNSAEQSATAPSSCSPHAASPSRTWRQRVGAYVRSLLRR